MLSNLLTYLSKNPDFEIEIKEVKFSVNKTLLSASCEYFRSYFASRLSKDSESVHFDNKNPQIIAHVIKFLQIGKIPEFEDYNHSGNHKESTSYLKTVIEVALEAMFFGIPLLEHYCEETLRKSIQKTIDNCLVENDQFVEIFYIRKRLHSLEGNCVKAMLKQLDRYFTATINFGFEQELGVRNGVYLDLILSQGFFNFMSDDLNVYVQFMEFYNIMRVDYALKSEMMLRHVRSSLNRLKVIHNSNGLDCDKLFNFTMYTTINVDGWDLSRIIKCVNVLIDIFGQQVVFKLINKKVMQLLKIKGLDNVENNMKNIGDLGNSNSPSQDSKIKNSRNIDSISKDSDQTPEDESLCKKLKENS